MRQGDSVLTARAIWDVGRIGKPFLAHYQQVYRNIETSLGFFEAATGLTIITSQRPPALWHDDIGDPTVADAILDRVVHNAHKLGLKGPSRRKEKTIPTTT